MHVISFLKRFIAIIRGGGSVSAYKRNNIKLGGRQPSADGIEDPAAETIQARRR